MSTQTNDMNITIQNTTLVCAYITVPIPHDTLWIISGDLVLIIKASKRHEISSAALASDI